MSRRRPFLRSTSGRGRSRYRPCVDPWGKGQTARYRRRVEREQFVPEPELGLVHVSQLARCPEFTQKVPEKILKEFAWAVFVGIRESRFVRVPVYTRMHELSVATLKTLAYLTKGIVSNKMTKEHRNKLDPGTKALWNEARHRV